MSEMRGTVIGVDGRRGFLAMQIDSGMVVVLELVSGPMPAIDDRGRGDLTRLATVDMRNMSSERDFKVAVHKVGCSLESALEMIGAKTPSDDGRPARAPSSDVQHSA